jgi:hypothetical protein
MLLEGRNNTLAATQRYQSKELKLSGLVITSGKKRMEHDLGRNTTEGRWVEATASSSDLEYPFVEIRDAEHPSQDYVTCYLEQSDAVPQLAASTAVRVDGFLVEYVVAAGHVQAILNRCSVQPER